MPCKQWKDEWIAHLYDELEPDESARLVDHLSACADCRDTLEALSESRRLLQEGAPRVPEAPRVVILERRRPWQPAWAFVGGAACALILFGAGLLTAGGLSLGSAAPVTVPEGVVLSADLDRALRQQRQEFETRLAAFDGQREAAGPATGRALTRDQLERELSRIREELRYDQARDFRLLLGEISATEARTAGWIDENREVLRYALRNYPGVGEH